jgi:hypothetical protein
VGADDGECLAGGDVFDVAGGDEGSGVGAGAEVLGSGAGVGGVGVDHPGGFVVGHVECAPHVGTFADPGGQGAVVGPLRGLEQVDNAAHPASGSSAVEFGGSRVITKRGVAGCGRGCTGVAAALKFHTHLHVP